jgi:GTPase SAR1 family protein
VSSLRDIPHSGGDSSANACAPPTFRPSLPRRSADDRLRPLSYPGTNIFLVCFSITSPTSYENVRTKWFPELRFHMPNTPFVVVGTKLDMRANEEVVARLRAEGKAPLTTLDGQRLAAELGAICYLECSALSQVGLKTVFDTSIRGALEHMERPEEGKKKSGKKCEVQ